ncbi:hypothetical protein BCR32DRAFT_14908 [Anaeromyces robustus]|uniref:Uncharacterized protein n=1 Tax=Anaeromyces robustus TaxID=1754192 RepID=A0A1Y1X6V3_9FUNG|nr:hypothetical protein BCR32DRAFT_14908 [Anaeromyces robustus]|eukprot:ORX81034.1 hypothetical protein BCR32DRAFT_14908 [Anaeromyces robustus]
MSLIYVFQYIHLYLFPSGISEYTVNSFCVMRMFFFVFFVFCFLHFVVQFILQS